MIRVYYFYVSKRATRFHNQTTTEGLGLAQLPDPDGIGLPPDHRTFLLTAAAGGEGFQSVGAGLFWIGIVQLVTCTWLGCVLVPMMRKAVLSCTVCV